MASTTAGSGGDLALEILQILSQTDSFVTAVRFPDISNDQIKSAIDRLKSRSMIAYDTVEREEAILEPEGEQIVAHGSHEARVFEAVHQGLGALTIQDLESKIGDKNVTKLGQGKAFKEKWIKKDGSKLVALVELIKDVTRDQLQFIKDNHKHDTKIVADLKKRKLVKIQVARAYQVSKGPNFALTIVKEETDLTSDMLTSGSWQTETFKPYNFKAMGAAQNGGALHPLNKMRAELRNVFFEMGFTEMPTNYYVDSGFWNFDALFVPQQHPARDLQDTFYVSDPPTAGKPTATSPDDKADYAEYMENVKAVHQNGKFGSKGYRYPWSEDESFRLVLRTHTTTVSAAMLHKLAQSNKGGRAPPARYFSIDRVFR
jgi:phenylalanyl-tRNA synthetase alpha chain